MIDFDFNKYCYGCRNCENVCPVGAITMIENIEGFLVPTIDKEKCINCKKCDLNCPHMNFKEYGKIIDKKWLGIFKKNENERIQSTSGAIFPMLSDKILEEGGFVCGCIWDENLNPIHIISNNSKEIEKMRGSKYVQSDMNNILNKIKVKAKNTKVLFTGTPCQVAAIKSAITSENLYTCSLICEGVPSNKIWKKYVENLENKYKSKLKDASFRNKEISWDSPVARYVFSDGRIVKMLSYSYDRYVKGFLQGLYYRNSCNNCQYKGNGHNADIIIGDLWGVNKELRVKSNNKGISLVIINSKKGEELFESIRNSSYFEEIDKDIAIQNNKLLMNSIDKNVNRDNFFENLDNMDIIKNININVKDNKFIGILKECLYKLKLFELIKKIRHGGK